MQRYFFLTALLLFIIPALAQTKWPEHGFPGQAEKAPGGRELLPPLPGPFHGLDLNKLLGIPDSPQAEEALPENEDQPGRPAASQKAAPAKEAAEKSAAAAAEELKRALAPHPPPEVLRREMLNDLFARLRKAADSDDAAQLAATIQEVFLQSFSDTGNLLMQRAQEALHMGQFELSLSLLDKLVFLEPQWAEAWNQRATVRFLNGDYDGSMADIHQVLKLEPRHFGALTGMGMILHEMGFDKDALKIFNQTLNIYPLAPDIKKLVEKLTLEVEGRGI